MTLFCLADLIELALLNEEKLWNTLFNAGASRVPREFELVPPRRLCSDRDIID
jgi:hypothetical protein